MREIDAKEFLTKIKDGGCVIDVRTPAEFRGGSVEGARNIPLDQLKCEDLMGVSGPIYLLCQGGMRAGKAATLLSSGGIENVVVVRGGMKACMSDQVACSCGGVISVDRQVRIVVGVMILCGEWLGFNVAPGYHFLSVFAGCGLLIAGLTDYCPLALLIARMPWNR